MYRINVIASPFGENGFGVSWDAGCGVRMRPYHGYQSGEAELTYLVKVTPHKGYFDLYRLIITRDPPIWGTRQVMAGLAGFRVRYSHRNSLCPGLLPRQPPQPPLIC